MAGTFAESLEGFLDLFKKATFSARLIFKATFLVDEGSGSEVDPTDNSVMGMVSSSGTSSVIGGWIGSVGTGRGARDSVVPSGLKIVTARKRTG